MKSSKGLVVGLVLIGLVALGSLIFGLLNYWALQRSEKIIGGLTAQVENLGDTLKGVTLELKEVRKERDALRGELAETKKALDKQTGRIAELKKAVDKQLGELKKLGEELAEMKVGVLNLDGRLTHIENVINQAVQPDSMADMLARKIASLEDSLKSWSRPSVVINPTTQTFFSDWEVQGGVMVWSAGDPWDLSVPYIGLALKQKKWALTLQGGFTPWSRQGPLGARGDALIFGGVDLFPDRWIGLKTGVVAGWEFFTSGPHPDTWTMKIIGATVGPSFRWKFLEGFAGYTIGNVSSLTEPDRWRSGGIVSAAINLK